MGPTLTVFFPDRTRLNPDAVFDHDPFAASLRLSPIGLFSGIPAAAQIPKKLYNSTSLTYLGHGRQFRAAALLASSAATPRTMPHGPHYQFRPAAISATWGQRCASRSTQITAFVRDSVSPRTCAEALTPMGAPEIPPVSCHRRSTATISPTMKP